MPTVVDEDLTDMYIRVYDAIRQCWERYGMGPSQGELMKACGYSSTSIHKAYVLLRRKGYIEAQKFHVRGGKPTDMERRILNKPPDPYAQLDEEERYWQ